jgi:hypothetical protein
MYSATQGQAAAADRSASWNSQRPRFAAATIRLNVAPLERTARGAAIDEANTALEVEVLINDLQPVEGTRMGEQSHDWRTRLRPNGRARSWRRKVTLIRTVTA